MANWTRKVITDKQAEIKQELDGVLESGGLGAKKKRCFEQIKRFSADIDPENQLKCFIYIMSLLLQHQKVNNLREKEAQDLIEHAFAILHIMKLHSAAHPLGFMVGDVHALSSQINRKTGNHWQSAWEQHNANRFYQYEKSRSLDAKKMALALRSQRLGQLRIARELFDEVLSKSSDLQLRGQASINILRQLRWQNEWEAWEDESQKLDEQGLAGSLSIEYEWEKICKGMHRHGEIGDAINAISSRGSHFQPVYICEGHLWCFSHTDPQWQKRLTLMATHRKNPKLKMKHMNFSLKACLVLEQAQDEEISFEKRLNELGGLIAEKQGLQSIELEMLLLIAIGRWLAKNRIRDLARLVLEEYRLKSLTYSDGKIEDMLNLGADLLKKSWFK